MSEPMLRALLSSSDHEADGQRLPKC